MRMCPICPEQHFFGTNHYFHFHLPIGPFHCAKFKNFFTVDPELWGCTIFGPKMVYLPQTNLFWKIINTILIYLLDPFTVQNLKKKPVNEPCFFHSCLSTCQKPNHVSGPFLTIFGHFCPIEIFSKKPGCVTYNYIWAPNTMLSFRKN